jgi:hypothetical protein
VIEQQMMASQRPRYFERTFLFHGVIYAVDRDLAGQMTWDIDRMKRSPAVHL